MNSNKEPENQSIHSNSNFDSFWAGPHRLPPRAKNNAGSWLRARDIIAELRRPEGPPSGAPYPYRKPTTSVDNTLLDLQNSSYPTQPHSIIAKYYIHELRGASYYELLYEPKIKYSPTSTKGHLPTTPISLQRCKRS